CHSVLFLFPALPSDIHTLSLHDALPISFGLVFLFAVTSVAIIAWFIRNPQCRNVWVRIIAPGIAAVGLTAVFLMILVNFDLMIEDRKSTRLNSIHVSISYAVFCLKKKRI